MAVYGSGSRVRRPVVVGALSALALVAVAACSSASGGSTGAGSGARKVSIVAYSVPKPAYDALEAAFQATPQGKGVSFAASYGASGDQSRAVANGQKADYVSFSIEPDVTRLVPQFVPASWNTTATKGLVSDSVVVFVVRKGNPKGIKAWDDLLKPGVNVVTPDPGSSGSAKWNLLGAYAHGFGADGGQSGGLEFVTKLAGHIVSKPESGSKATQTFLNGTGDVLLSYEDEAIAARQKGQDLDYVVPADSILIQIDAAVTTSAPQAAKDFYAFATSAAGQKIFAGKGFRPVIDGLDVGTVAGANDPVHPFPTVPTLTTIDQLGGWKDVNKRFFDKTGGLITKILGG